MHSGAAVVGRGKAASTMHARDVVKYGQLTLLGAVDGLAEAAWEEPGVCGAWSVRQIVAHLDSYEAVLLDVLGQMAGEPERGDLARYRAPDGHFNDDAVAARATQSPAALLASLQVTHGRCLELLERMPPELLARTGTIPWYGAEYAVDDFIVYANYGHKREHCAQIDRFRSTLNGQPSHGS